MYTLKDVFPDPKKPHKKNFVRENAKNLKYIQGKAAVDVNQKSGRESRVNEPLASVKSSGSNRSHGKASYTVSKTSMRKKLSPEIKFKKGDMSEFLKRKELRTKTGPGKPGDLSPTSTASPGRLRDVGCQTIESNLSQKLAEQRLTVLYPKEEESCQQKASGDSQRTKSPSPPRVQNGHKGDDENPDSERKKMVAKTAKPVEKDKDPFLPNRYQKGVLPRYLRERRDEQNGNSAEPFDAECPPGHIALPDTERKETLRMLRNSFAEMVSELNKMPVRTDTLRMRARKMELEKQLTKLEEGIKVFSRPKVFVRIGE